ncbi:MAG: hypothetical protein Q8L24_02115 [bacterium]|nr:hypothetical protein [bacterium]
MSKEATGKIIGFDMDGVIIDNTANKIKLAKRFGVDLSPGDTTADFIETIVPEEILAKMRPLLYDDPVMALEASLLDGAREGLLRVKDSGQPYFLISRRRNSPMAIKLLEKHGIWPAIFNEKNAFFVREPEEKNAHAIRLGIDLYVDDQPSVLAKLPAVKTRLLFDRFGKFGPLSFVNGRISSWEELLGHLI